MCFYQKGLCFKCQGCGSCCTGFPGFVWLKKNEIINISAYLKIDKNTFLKNYTFQAYGMVSLKEIKPSYDCIFFKDKKCQIYPVRPFQCIAFPFWPHNVESQESWQTLKKSCPGIDQGDLHPPEKIQAFLDGYQTDLA